MDSDQMLVVAGEVSGDIHGAHLLAALQRQAGDLRAFGMGGSHLRRQGLDIVVESSEIAVVGLLEALTVLPRARRAFRRLLAEVERRRPAVAVLIDSPDFNLRLARRLAARGVRVVYYVSPQVWAWRSGRVRTIARWVERMLVLFPFERDWYAERGVDVVHVGHPLVDQVGSHPQAWETALGPGERYRLAILPGSRPSEVAMLLPVMLAAAESLGRDFPIQLQVIQAPDLPDELMAPALAASEVPIDLVREGRAQAIADSHLALCASGTATLEVGLLGTPMVVVYKVKRWSHLLGRLVIEVPHISLVNLVLGDEVVTELIQERANAPEVAAAAATLLSDAALREAQRRRLGELREALGAPGASERAAAEILSVRAAA